MIALAVVLAASGFAGLYLARADGWRRTFDHPPAPWLAPALRLIAAGLLAAALAPCLVLWDWRQALVAWSGALSAGGLAVVLAVAFGRR